MKRSMLVEKILKRDWAKFADIYGALRGTVRTKTDVPGTTTTFAAPDGVVDCHLEEYYSGDWIEEDLNQHMNRYETAELYSLVTALNLNRKANKLIVDALCNSKVQLVEKSQLDLGAICDILKNDMSDGISAVICYDQWNKIKILAESIGKNIEDGDTYMGINWKLSNDLPIVDNKRRCFIYHRSAVGFADSGKFKIDGTWHGERAQYFVNACLKMGATVINPNHIYEIDCEETPDEK